MRRPAGSPWQPEDEWSRAIYERSGERAAASRRWSARVLSPSQKPQEWERRLEQRLNLRLPKEDDLALAAAAENTRRGTPGDQLIHLSDPVGRKPAPPGEPFSSDVAGLIYSLWIWPILPLSGGPAVAEIMRPDTPVEVLGLVPIPPGWLRDLPGWRAGLVGPGAEPGASTGVTRIEFGHVPIDVREAKALFPNLAVTRASVFVRLRLDEAPARESLGTAVRITLTSPARARLWFWLGA